ncbi:MAG: cold shock domain-containing protein [Oceanospirillaceae bacterium]|nr:cold shock domain-containing protein [Oceanospirillaceae bacterium]
MSGVHVLKNVVISIIAVAVIAAAWQMLGVDNYVGVLAVAFVTLLIATSVAASSAKPSAAPGDAEAEDEDYPDDDAEGREQGTVKFFNVKEGWGFITRSEGDDVFVHFRNIRGRGHRSLNEGQRVSFSVGTTDKGLQAEDVAVMRD